MQLGKISRFQPRNCPALWSLGNNIYVTLQGSAMTGVNESLSKTLSMPFTSKESSTNRWKRKYCLLWRKVFWKQPRPKIFKTQFGTFVSFCKMLTILKNALDCLLLKFLLNVLPRISRFTNKMCKKTKLLYWKKFRQNGFKNILVSPSCLSTKDL